MCTIRHAVDQTATSNSSQHAAVKLINIVFSQQSPHGLTKTLTRFIFPFPAIVGPVPDPDPNTANGRVVEDHTGNGPCVHGSVLSQLFYPLLIQKVRVEPSASTLCSPRCFFSEHLFPGGYRVIQHSYWAVRETL